VDTALPSISPSEIHRLIGRSDAPLLLDVRRPERFAASDTMLPGAVRCRPEDIGHWRSAPLPRMRADLGVTGEMHTWKAHAA
jgi:hypothetical protein